MSFNSNFNVELPVFKDNEINIASVGAISGGIVSNTKIINDAIDMLFKKGGGRVIIPSGIYLTGPIKLLSGINLHIEKGAVLLFSKNKEEYPLIRADYEGQPRIRSVSPISAYDAENIAITGGGVVDGGGHRWRPVKEFKVTKRQWERLLKENDSVIESKEGGIWLPTKSAYDGYKAGEPDINDDDALEKAAPYYDYYRPVLVNFVRCNKVLIDEVTLMNSPAWNVHPLFCTNVTISNAKIKNPEYAQNGDGLDLESCRYVHIHDVTFDVGDDAICMKSGKNAIARKVPVPTEDVYIHDCTVFKGHGGFVVGSEMSRGIRNVMCENLTFVGTDTGIRFKSAIGRGGKVENITLKDINMTDITGEAVIFTMGYVLNTMDKDDEEELSKIAPEDIPEFCDITIKNVKCTSAKTSVKIEGLKAMPIHDITIEDSDIVADNSYEFKYAENINIINSRI